MARQDEQTKVRQIGNACDGKGIMMLLTTITTGIGAHDKILKPLKTIVTATVTSISSTS